MDKFITRKIRKEIQKETKKARSMSRTIDKFDKQMQTAQADWIKLINRKNEFIDILNR